MKFCLHVYNIAYGLGFVKYFILVRTFSVRSYKKSLY